MIAITYENEEYRPQAEALAARYHLELIPYYQCSTYAGLIIIITTDYIGLVQGPTQPFKNKPFYIDFYTGTLAYRSKQAGLRKEAIARAIGVKPHDTPFIVDATAGLGRDSFILATCGFNITMLERSPVLWILMEDALKRAQAHSSLSSIIERMSYIQADAHSWLTQLTTRPDIIYLDPMFPERKKTAAVKKEMVLLQTLVGEDTDADALLHLALTCANNRVVVKRPRLAEPLMGAKPNFSLTGKSSRFDIYLVKT